MVAEKVVAEACVTLRAGMSDARAATDEPDELRAWASDVGGLLRVALCVPALLGSVPLLTSHVVASVWAGALRVFVGAGEGVERVGWGRVWGSKSGVENNY